MKVTDSIQYIKGVGPKKKAELNRLGIVTVYDLLTYFPRTYEDQSVLTRISDLRVGEQQTISGIITKLQERQGGRRGMTILTALISDGSGFLQVTWFNQNYLKKQLQVGRRIFVTGRASYAFGGRGQFAMSQLSSFQILTEEEDAAAQCGIQPVYPATERLNQKFFRKLLKEALAADVELPEVLPVAVCRQYHLMARREALATIHFPKDFTALKAARRRLAFEELYLIQCGLMLLKQKLQQSAKGIRHGADGVLLQRVEKACRLPLRMIKMVPGRISARIWNVICRCAASCRGMWAPARQSLPCWHSSRPWKTAARGR